MEKVKAFCKRKNIEISVKRYLIDALGAMAQGLFASLLIGTIISTLGTQLNIPILVTVGTYAKAAVGPAMAIAIGYALQAAPLVLFSLAAVGAAANELGGAGGPLAVLVVAIFAAEFGKAVSKGDKNRYYCHSVCDHFCRGRAFYLVGSGDRCGSECSR